VKKSTFPTPQDAEAAFYEALESGDLEAIDGSLGRVHETMCRLRGAQTSIMASRSPDSSAFVKSGLRVLRVGKVLFFTGAAPEPRR